MTKRVHCDSSHAESALIRPVLEIGRQLWSLTLLLTLLAFSACQSVAGTCAIEPQAAVPVEAAGSVPTVSVILDGKPATLILDSGAERTALTLDALKRLNIRFDFAHQATAHGIGAEMTTVTARIRSFEIGGMVLRDRLVPVVPISLPKLPGGQPDGLLGADILSGYDVDLDLPHAMMTLYRARPCPDSKPPWNAAYITFRGRLHRNRLLIPIELDGQQLAAVLDTGASAGVTIGEAAALRIGVTEEALGQDPMLSVAGVARDKVGIHLHRFALVKVGPDIVRNPVLPVAPLPDSAFGALIGASYLKARHVWLSYPTAQVFVLSITARPAKR
jgi:predicted aspartyl protease